MVVQYLRDLGYAAVAQRLKTSDYSIPQRRTRYYIIGLRQVSNFASSAYVMISSLVPRLNSAKSELFPIVAHSLLNCFGLVLSCRV